MDQQVLPALIRLRHALLTSATTTTRIGSQLYAAERESAALFGGIGTRLPPSVGFTAAPNSGDSAVASMFVKLDASGSNTEQPLFSTVVLPQSEQPQLYEDVDALISEGGGIAALVGAIPEVAQWEQMSSADLGLLRATLIERQDLITLLLGTTSLPGSPMGLPLNGQALLNLSVVGLRTLVQSNDQQERYSNILQMLVLWAFEADPIAGAEVRERFWQLSPIERFEFLYSLNEAMQATPDYWPRDPISLDRLPPPVAMALDSPSPAVQSLLNFTVTRARELMAAAGVADGVQSPLVLGWLNTHFGDDTVGEQILNGPEILAAIIPPTRAAWTNLGLFGKEVDVLADVSTYISTGQAGIKRNKQFFVELGENDLRRLAQGVDPLLHTQIHGRIIEIRNMTPEQRRLLGFSELEVKANNLLTRTDIPVPGIQTGDSPLMYGVTRNTTGKAMAWEFISTGKPDPTIAVYATLPDGPVEFDWYRLNEAGGLVLQDAKRISPYGPYDLNAHRWDRMREESDFFDGAERQSEAARMLGENVRVEWIVPPLPPVGHKNYEVTLEMYEELQRHLTEDLRLSNISVVWETSAP